MPQMWVQTFWCVPVQVLGRLRDGSGMVPDSHEDFGTSFGVVLLVRGAGPDVGVNEFRDGSPVQRVELDSCSLAAVTLSITLAVGDLCPKLENK